MTTDLDSLTQLAREAWRNHPRCIGRLFWNTLEVLDARSAITPPEIFEACIEHLRYATNGGRIRSTITLFAATPEGARGIRIWNHQLLRYAGYLARDATILGDPAQVAFTQRVLEMGWQPPRQRSAFDLLPLVIDAPGHSPQLFDIPADAALEVPLTHPELPWFADLRLKWHALPVISDQALVGHGHRFTAAPFSGYYMGTEIGSRNLGDVNRYNLLPVIAERMGLDRSARRMLWKDRALVELNTAVLHSFREAGVAIVDHHTASAQFMQHLKNEESCGRSVPGDWSWLVPPMSGSACPVFHRYYDAPIPDAPAFVPQSSAW
ncbi:nitric-oxide synthase [Haloferula luteola]|uniref:Nitric-oxide synthase n=1 Tax=Haloferula luteola TaxID=595692 RepID=A0A840V2U3_9BACT|nr:nitric oxide synthase oxygenase [Haloferula luteola]MBB5352315.1 nitric-oxide synthase [Haloferula luteola]